MRYLPLTLNLLVSREQSSRSGFGNIPWTFRIIGGVYRIKHENSPKGSFKLRFKLIWVYDIGSTQFARLFTKRYLPFLCIFTLPKCRSYSSAKPRSCCRLGIINMAQLGRCTSVMAVPIYCCKLIDILCPYQGVVFSYYFSYYWR